MDVSTSRGTFHVSKTYCAVSAEKLTLVTGRFPLAFQCVPALILVSGIWFLQESPRWLCEKDRWEEARAVLQKLHNDGTAETDQRIELEFREIRDVIEADRINNSTSISTIFTKASWRKRLLLGCGVQAFGPLSGINVINYYGPEIYKILGIDNSTSLMIIGISGSLSIVYCTIGLWALERFGRVKPLIISAAGLGAALVCNAAMSQHLDPSNGNMLRAMVAMNFVFSLFYTPLGIISWVYPAEIFPVEVRAFGNATTTFTNWVLNLIFAQFSPQALDSIGFRYFYVFFVFNVIAMLCYIFFYPGKSPTTEPRYRTLMRVSRNKGKDTGTNGRAVWGSARASCAPRSQRCGYRYGKGGNYSSRRGHQAVDSTFLKRCKEIYESRERVEVRVSPCVSCRINNIMPALVIDR